MFGSMSVRTKNFFFLLANHLGITYDRFIVFVFFSVGAGSPAILSFLIIGGILVKETA
jgi:hypothetical protein